MSKKSYKRNQNRLYREIKARIAAEGRIHRAESEAEVCRDELKKLRKRFRWIGTIPVYEHIDSKDTRVIEVETLAVGTESWGNYAVVADWDKAAEIIDEVKKSLAVSIAEGLMDSELIQFTLKEPEYYEPLYQFGTVGARLIVVPWERMIGRKYLEINRWVRKRRGER